MVIASRTAASGRSALNPMRSVAAAMPEPMPEPRPAPRQFVERADLHGDQRGMAVVGIEHADADADPCSWPRAQADAAGSTPRLNAFSANQTE